MVNFRNWRKLVKQDNDVIAVLAWTEDRNNIIILFSQLSPVMVYSIRLMAVQMGKAHDWQHKIATHTIIKYHIATCLLAGCLRTTSTTQAEMWYFGVTYRVLG